MTDVSRDEEQVAPGTPGKDQSAERVKRLLSDHFSVKRDSKRSFKLLDVEVGGEIRTYQGLAIDVSRSGLLLRIMDPQFAAADGGHALMEYSDLVRNEFGKGCE